MGRLAPGLASYGEFANFSSFDGYSCWVDLAGADWHFHAYAGVKHGFTNPGPTTNPATAYNASADRQSWTAMYALFDEVLA